MMCKMYDPQRENEAILDIWKDGPEEYTERMPMQYPHLKKNVLLFVGINPSWSNDNNDNYIYDYQTFRNSNGNEKRIIVENIVKNERDAKEEGGYDRYFRPLRDIANFVEMPFEHVDLLLQRHAKQSEIANEYSIKRSGEVINVNKMIEFARRQLNLSISLIQILRPKIIVVANALASKIVAGHLNLNLDQIYETGFCTYVKDQRETPIILTGMVSGQRALDTGTRRILAYHINMIMQHLNGQ